MTNLKKITEINPNSITPDVLHEILFQLATQVETNTLKANFALEKVIPYKTLKTHPLPKISAKKILMVYQKSRQLPNKELLAKKYANKGVVVAVSQDVFLEGWNVWIKPHDDISKKPKKKIGMMI